MNTFHRHRNKPVLVATIMLNVENKIDSYFTIQLLVLHPLWYQDVQTKHTQLVSQSYAW